MTADETRRLDLAHRAWQATAPADDEVELAVRRIRRAVNAPRRSRARTLPVLAAAALVLGGALAYAANGGYSALLGGQRSQGAHPHRSGSGVSAAADRALTERGGGTPRPALVGPNETPAPAARALEAPGEKAPAPSPALAGASQQHSVHVQPDSASGTDQSGQAAGARRSAADTDTGWRQVGEALAAGDEARASRALKLLARDGDPQTRAKAELGLARLAAGAGDCQRARRLALGVARTPGLDEKLVERAHDVVLRCEGR